MPWVVLVPLKPLRQAKSRLALPAQARAAVTAAMAADTVAAAAATPGVARVVVVTAEPAPWMPATMPDAGGGLSAAVGTAAGQLVDQAVAVLAGDLPALRPAELALALALSAESPSSVLADAVGTGTVLLTAGPGARLRPSYGDGSLARHVVLGAADVTPAVASAFGPDCGLRRDVDLPADWAAALALGVGPATAALGDVFRLAG